MASETFDKPAAAHAAISVRELAAALPEPRVRDVLLRLPGVTGVELNYPAAIATMSFDPRATDRAAIERQVRECAEHCRSEPRPDHDCITQVRDVRPPRR